MSDLPAARSQMAMSLAFHGSETQLNCCDSVATISSSGNASALHHVGKIGCVKAAGKLSDQFLRQRGKNLFTISAALVL
jgi:hypothetical protein